MPPLWPISSAAANGPTPYTSVTVVPLAATATSNRCLDAQLGVQPADVDQQLLREPFAFDLDLTCGTDGAQHRRGLGGRQLTSQPSRCKRA